MEQNQLQRRKHFLVNLAYWLVLLGIVYVVLKYLIRLIMPFFLALILASVSRPIAKYLSRETKTVRGPDGTKQIVPKKWRPNKKFIAILSVIIVFIVILGIFTLICFRIADRAADLISAAPQIYVSRIQPGLEEAYNKTKAMAAGIDNSILELAEKSAGNIIGSLGSKVTDLSGKLLARISSVATKVPSMLLNTVICLIATVFMAVDFDDIRGIIHRSLPERTLRLVIEFKNSLVDNIWQFIKSYFIIFLITTAEITLGFLIVGQARPLLLGILIAVFDAFPIVGSGMILLPLSIITMITGRIGKGIGLFFVYVVVVVVRQVIEPRIVGKHVGLRPLVTLICMFVGTKLFGGIGLFALPILAAILTDMHNRRKENPDVEADNSNPEFLPEADEKDESSQEEVIKES